MIQLVGRASEAVLRRLEYPSGFIVLPDERDRHVSRPGFHREAYLQTGISRLHVHFPFGIALILSDKTLCRRPALGLTTHIEPLEKLAIQADFDLVWIPHADDVVVQLSSQQHLDAVLGIDGKVMANHRAALRPKGEILARPVVLHQRFGDLIRVDDRRHGGIANGEATDSRGRRQVAFEQHGRNREHARDVVETLLIRVVGRQ